MPSYSLATLNHAMDRERSVGSNPTPSASSFSPRMSVNWILRRSTIFQRLLVALSEKTARARETTEPYVSRRTELPPFGQSDGTVPRENVSAGEVTFLIEVIVDRSVDRSEFL